MFKVCIGSTNFMHLSTMEVSFFVKNSRNKQKTPKMLIQGPGAAGSQNFLLVLTPNLDFLG